MTNQQAASATVDKKDAFLDTTVRVAEEQLRSEQATVDEIRTAIHKKYDREKEAEKSYPSMTELEKAHWRGSIQTLEELMTALHSQQEKRYTREDVIKIGLKLVGGERFLDFVGVTLDQFDKEGK